MSRLSLIAALILLAFLSCTKEQSNSQGNRLKMIRVTEGDSVFYRTFRYDDQGRLSFILDSNNNGHKRTLDITYNSGGQLVKVTEGADVHLFESDNKGRIIKKTLAQPGQSNGHIENTYSYDDNGRVITDSVYSYWTSSVYQVTVYSYDQQNNISETKLIEKASGIISGQQQCFYDNHPNPLDATNILSYFLNSGYDIPEGKNNLLKIVGSDGTIVNYSYIYYNNDLPKKRTELINNDPLVTYTDYYYE